MLIRKCDVCGKELSLTPEEDSYNGFFRLMVDDFTKCTSGVADFDRKYIDVCPDCFSDAMDGINGSLVLRKLIGQKYDWTKIGFNVE